MLLTLIVFLPSLFALIVLLGRIAGLAPSSPLPL